jgi:hypothetical protein
MPLCTSEIEFELLDYIQDFKLDDDAEVYPNPSQGRPSRSVGWEKFLRWLCMDELWASGSSTRELAKTPSR